MATTPTYSWPTPDDSDLVRDGALAIRDLGDAIDTTVSDIDQGTTKGDLLVYDGTDYQRLGVGTDDQLLIADSGEATGIKWGTPSSGGMTLLASGTLSGATLDLTSIPQDYNEIKFYFQNGTASTTATVNLEANGASGTAYNYVQLQSSTSTVTVAASQSRFGLSQMGTATGTSSQPGTSGVATFSNYNRPASEARIICYFHIWSRQQLDSDIFMSTRSDGPMTSMQLKLSTGTFTGGTYELWGVK